MATAKKKPSLVPSFVPDPKKKERIFVKNLDDGSISIGRVRAMQDFTAIRLYIDDFLHAHIVKKKYCGTSSYQQDGIYYVEIVFDTKRLLLCHESRELWEEILLILNEVL